MKGVVFAEMSSLQGVRIRESVFCTGHTVAGQQQRQHKPSHPNPSHPHTSHPHSSHSSHHHNMSSQNKRHGPTELSLGSFMTTPTTGARPHTPMNRPQRNTNKTTAELRQAELEQLATRFQGNHHLVEKGRERSVYRLTFAPTDPDWVSGDTYFRQAFTGCLPSLPSPHTSCYFPCIVLTDLLSLLSSSFPSLPLRIDLYMNHFLKLQSFSFKTIDLELTFPHDYPAQALAINLPTDQKLHSVYLNHGNLAVSRYLATAPGGSGELMLRPFLRWLDKTITNNFKDAAKQVSLFTLILWGTPLIQTPLNHKSFLRCLISEGGWKVWFSGKKVPCL